ncbi:MAG: hypothetical protein NTV52_01650 [Acidobacteria bacterium]|nr:hypothetical protein [Acidobacteriota bacterium]
MDKRISDAWQQAAADLGITVVAPVSLTTDRGQIESFEAHILDFGGPKGTIAGALESYLNDSPTRLGYYFSSLFPSYRVYERQLFIDTLNDWGWFGGEDRAPDWYTGEPWS